MLYATHSHANECRCLHFVLSLFWVQIRYLMIAYKCMNSDTPLIYPNKMLFQNKIRISLISDIFCG